MSTDSTPAHRQVPSPARGSSTPLAAGRGGGRSGAAARRRERQQEIVQATRELFDVREMRDANIEDIAKAVGINRAIIYRHFASKDELFALTLAEYLQDLDELLQQVDGSLPPPERLAGVTRVFADFCLQYPAFLDCAFALLRQPGEYLFNEISDQAMGRLGRFMATSLGRISVVLKAGRETGDFAVEGDVDIIANAMYLQTLGALHVARSGFVVRESPSGQPEVQPVADETIRDLVVRMAVATARG